MTHTYRPLRSLKEYQAFLKHPEPLVRQWAVRRIEEQYPQHAAESFAGLLTDSDDYLQIAAAQALGDSGDARYEPALLAVWPQSKGSVRNWFTTALGQLRSPTLLPHLIAELDSAPARCPAVETRMLALRSVVEALGYYPDEMARSTLRRFVEHYQDNDRVTYAAFRGLLRFIDPATLSGLAQRYGYLPPPSRDAWEHAGVALAEVVGLKHLTEELTRLIPYEPDELIFLLDDWLSQEIPYSESFEAAFDETAFVAYAGLLPHILAELERAAAKRGDDLSAWLEAWRAGERPDGYRWRMLYTYHLITALAKHPPSRPKQYQAAIALGLALLAQALVDQNDEAMLQAAPNELIRQAILLGILESPRQQVMPDVVDQVVALGPGVTPHLINILEANHFWAWLRALEALTRIARTHPGAADEAIPAILELIDGDQSDYVLESAYETLVAIGPAVITPAAARLGLIDFTYDIYICNVLSTIPTPVSAEALLGFIAAKDTLAEYEAEALASLGDPMALIFLRDYFDWSDDPLLCTVLYKLALLNDYTGPELAEWRSVALDHYAEVNRLLSKLSSRADNKEAPSSAQ